MVVHFPCMTDLCTQVYLYTSSASSDKKSNHFTQFSGVLLRPSQWCQQT